MPLQGLLGEMCSPDVQGARGGGSPTLSVMSVVTLRPVLFAALAIAAVACGSQSFDPTGPCDTDGRMAGAYPDLEALVPDTFRGRPPDQLDSGRTCTDAGLGPLGQRGVEELRYAGATWSTGSQSGVTLAVFRGDGVDAAAMLEFYLAGTRSTRRIQRLDSGPVTRDGRQLQRLDALNDASDQTVVTWDDGELVRVALIADSVAALTSAADHERTVEEALEAAGL